MGSVSVKHVARALLLVVSLVLVARGSELEAKDPTRPELRVAQFQLPQLPGLSGPPADWRQWDAFFTFVVKRFGQDVSGDLRDQLGEAFLDSRYELTSTLARLPSGQDPVPDLFLTSWQRLSPIMNQALPAMPPQTAGTYSSFIGILDRLAAFGPAGAQTGLLRLSPDTLRSTARILDSSGSTDPIAYTLGVDNVLRNLLGFSPIPKRSAGSRPGRAPSPVETRLGALGSFWLGTATAAEPGARKLKEWVPDRSDLQSYLQTVRSLLTRLSDDTVAKSKLSEEHRVLYRQIVFAAAWQESCWRQYVKTGKRVIPLTSATGDLGLMQVNRKTWRSLYDLKGLSDDIQYNGNAGSEILLYYLSRYALRKNEDKQPGGQLARATYSAYNGGPGHLTRYRAAKQNPELRKVDEAFWNKFQAVSSGREMDVQSCYE
jgi:Transglycosylase SLT domain